MCANYKITERCNAAEVKPCRLAADGFTILMAEAVMRFPTEPDHIIRFWDDEIGFAPTELLGLTASEGDDLRRRKDIAYIQSED